MPLYSSSRVDEWVVPDAFAGFVDIYVPLAKARLFAFALKKSFRRVLSRECFSRV